MTDERKDDAKLIADTMAAVGKLIADRDEFRKRVRELDKILLDTLKAADSQRAELVAAENKVVSYRKAYCDFVELRNKYNMLRERVRELEVAAIRLEAARSVLKQCEDWSHDKTPSEEKNPMILPTHLWLRLRATIKDDAGDGVEPASEKAAPDSRPASLESFPKQCVACDTELEAGFFCPKCDSGKFYKPPNNDDGGASPKDGDDND